MSDIPHHKIPVAGVWRGGGGGGELVPVSLQPGGQSATRVPADADQHHAAAGLAHCPPGAGRHSWVNTCKPFSAARPFGGWHDSGLGRNQGPAGILQSLGHLIARAP